MFLSGGAFSHQVQGGLLNNGVLVAPQLPIFCRQLVQMFQVAAPGLLQTLRGPADPVPELQTFRGPADPCRQSCVLCSG